ncbi:MAG: hypothetical protein Kow0091_05970 [Geminocystis sp.]
MPTWSNRLQILALAGRDPGFFDPARTEGYIVVDYITSIDLGKGTLNIGIENLFNNQYLTPVSQLNAAFDGFAERASASRGRTITATYRPDSPQRVVTLQDIYLASAITLGIKPIASTTYSATDGIPFRGVSTEQIKGIELIGDGHQPNLEKLLSIKPDLILAREFHEDIYDRLLAIAPTVAVDWHR